MKLQNLALRNAFRLSNASQRCSTHLPMNCRLASSLRPIANGGGAIFQTRHSLLTEGIVGARQYSVSAPVMADLASVLASEAEAEQLSGTTGIPEELSSLQSKLESEWRIVDNQDSAIVQLFLKDEKVQLSFHCQDTIEEVGDHDEEDYAEDDDDDKEEEEDAMPVRFTVTETKAGKTLVINCISEGGEVKIEGVATSTQDVDSIHSQQGTLSKTSYEGPEFMELDEALQEAFYTYLEDQLAVTSDVAAFVAMYTDYKEQQLYCQFLLDAKSIIS